MTFEDVLEIKNGKNQRAVENPKGKYPIYGSGGIMGYANDYICQAETVIIGRKGSINKPIFVEVPFWNVDTAFGLEAKRELLLPRYLYYFCLRYDFERLNKAVTIPSLTKADLLKIQIELPPISRQADVVKRLMSLERVISLRQQQISILDELIKARFVEMFGTLELPVCEFKKDILKNLCYKITDGKHGGCTQEDGTGRYFVGAREIYDDAVHYETAPQINIEEFEKDYKRCNVEKGDLLIVNTGATIGKSAIAIDDRTEHTLLQKSVALLKVKQSVLHPVFLKFCYIVNDKMYRVESASAQPNLLISKINATEIYVPPMPSQKQFAAFVSQIDKSKSAIQRPLIRQAPGRQHDKAIFAILRKMIEIHFLPVMG